MSILRRKTGKYTEEKLERKLRKTGEYTGEYTEEKLWRKMGEYTEGRQGQVDNGVRKRFFPGPIR